jgi:hypothetical protein
MAIVISTQGPKVGQCNICGDIGPLTEDHTPPKGCLKPTQVEIRHIAGHLGTGPETERGRRSQNGVKYRTLCARCNSTLLGAKYDQHFIDFVNSISNAMKQSQKSLHSLVVPGRPQAILRSLIGHMAAQGVDRYLKGPLTQNVTDFILDETLPLPIGISVFYWAYPYRSHVMIRDAAYQNLRAGATPFAFWLLKFFPMAFMVTWDSPSGLEFNPHSFDAWRGCSYTDEVQIPISIHPTLPAFWPEAPTNQTLIMYGQEAIHVKKRHGG